MTVLRALNALGHALPKPVQRFIADFPGVLTVLAFLSARRQQFVTTPEGYRLAFNPLFHGQIVRDGRLEYEADIHEAVRRLCRPGMVAYDIGANIGVFSFFLRSLVGDGGWVYAFEPEPNNTACFERSLADNAVRNIVLDRRAVGAEPGRLQFDRRGGGFSGRLIGSTPGYRPTTNTTWVEVVTIDGAVEREGFRPPGFVKIDVEGNELAVLRGMRRVLERHRPVVLCEVHQHLGDSGADVLRLFAGCGYGLFTLDGATPVKDDGSAIPHHVIAMPAEATRA